MSLNSWATVCGSRLIESMVRCAAIIRAIRASNAIPESGSILTLNSHPGQSGHARLTPPVVLSMAIIRALSGMNSENIGKVRMDPLQALVAGPEFVGPGSRDAGALQDSRVRVTTLVAVGRRVAWPRARQPRGISTNKAPAAETAKRNSNATPRCENARGHLTRSSAAGARPSKRAGDSHKYFHNSAQPQCLRRPSAAALG
jgi:hypothetical protein